MKMLILAVFILCGGCSILDGLHQFQSGSLKSEPPYPPSIAEESCLWTEDGKTYLIDKNGIREIANQH